MYWAGLQRPDVKETMETGYRMLQLVTKEIIFFIKYLVGDCSNVLAMLLLDKSFLYAVGLLDVLFFFRLSGCWSWQSRCYVFIFADL